MFVFKSAVLLSALVASAAAKASTLKYCDEKVCINGVRDGGVDTYSIAPVVAIPEDEFGWLAMGFGKSMLNTPMVLLWPNEDCSITLSQRQTTAYRPPTVVAAPARVATLDEEKSYSNETATGFTFSLPSDEATEFPIIYAYSTTNPNSTDIAAAITKHAWTGHATLSFNKPKKCKPKARKRSTRKRLSWQ